MTGLSSIEIILVCSVAAAVTGVMTLSAVQQMKARLGSDGTEKHDEELEKQLRARYDSYIKEIDKLRAEKESIIGLDLHDIDTTPNWEEKVIESGEKLRDQVSWAMGFDSTDWSVNQFMKKIPMDYPLAHDLCWFFHARQDLVIKKREASIARANYLCRQKMKNFDLMQAVFDYEEMQESDQEVKKAEKGYDKAAKELILQYRRARDAYVAARESGA